MLPGSSGPAGKFDLVVVESLKAKTINKYFGTGFHVVASYGHVRDLSTRKQKGEEVAGIEIAKGWKLRYTVDDGSDDDGRPRPVASAVADARPATFSPEIRRAKPRRPTASCSPATPDREGESIAFGTLSPTN